MFVLKIHYQINELDGADEGSFSGVMATRGKGRKTEEGASGEGLGGGGLTGLMVGRKEIMTKDWKVMRRVYTAVQNYSRRSTIM